VTRGKVPQRAYLADKTARRKISKEVKDAVKSTSVSQQGSNTQSRMMIFPQM
jgi:hypothetical protein